MKLTSKIDITLANRIVAVMGALAFTALPAQAERKILFYDDGEILYKSGLRRVIKPLTKRQVVITPEGWEVGNTISISSISFSSARTPRYMMWYQVDSGTGFSGNDKEYDNVVAFATSTDGVTWNKPNIATDGSVSPQPRYPGSANNSNIVLTGMGATLGSRHGCSVVYDESESDPDKRYKMVYVDWKDDDDPSKGVGLQVAFSPDGKDWDKHPTNTSPDVLHKIAFNHPGNQPPRIGYSTWVPTMDLWRLPRTLSNVVNLIILPSPKTYVIYGRMDYDGKDGALGWRGGMGRSTSTDFINWSEPELVLTPEDYDPDTLGFQDTPVFVSGSSFFSFCQMTGTTPGTNDIQLLASRDGKKWNRYRPSEYENISVLPRATGSTAFDSKSIYTSASVVEGDSMRFYYGGNAVSGGTSSIAIADVKRDRLIGLKAVWSNTTGTQMTTAVSGNTVTLTSVRTSGTTTMTQTRSYTDTTPPAPGVAHLTFPEPEVVAATGQVTLKEIDFGAYTTLKINAVMAAGGEIRAEILTPQGFPLESFTGSNSAPMTTTNAAFEVTWNSQTIANLPPSPSGNINGIKKYLLRLYVKSAELFSCTLTP